MGTEKIQALERTRSLLITDTSANLQRILQILDYVDRPIETMEDVFRKTDFLMQRRARLQANSASLSRSPQSEQEDTPTCFSLHLLQPTPQTPAGIIRARRAAASAPQTAASDTSASAAAEALAERGIISGKS